MTCALKVQVVSIENNFATIYKNEKGREEPFAKWNVNFPSLFSLCSFTSFSSSLCPLLLCLLFRFYSPKSHHFRPSSSAHPGVEQGGSSSKSTGPGQGASFTPSPFKSHHGARLSRWLSNLTVQTESVRRKIHRAIEMMNLLHHHHHHHHKPPPPPPSPSSAPAAIFVQKRVSVSK